MNRERLLAALRGALEPAACVQAAWEGGAVAWGRLDEHSDVDLQLLCEPGQVDAVFELVEGCLAELGGIARRYALPEPTWHGHAQRFYQLVGAPPTLMLDLVVIADWSRWTELERERHAQPDVWFDRAGCVAATSLERDAFRARIAARLSDLKARFEMFQPLVTKELARGQDLEALAFYQSVTLRPLVELLRIRHLPERHDFHLRYAHHDLPAGVVAELRELAFVGAADELAAKRARAERRFQELWPELAARYAVT